MRLLRTVHDRVKMAAMSKTKQDIYTTAQAAKRIGRCDSRVRQLCNTLGIGRIVGSTRILTADDVQRIEQTERRDTRPASPR